MKLRTRQVRALLATPLLFLTSAAICQTASSAASDKTYRSILDHNFPRVVLVMTWDQLRADMMTRYSNTFLPANGSDGQVGGFRWLLENGAVMADTHYHHIPLHTGPGHATILTGASPSKSGIVGNSWYTSAGLTLNCVGDPDVRTIGGGESRLRNGSASPRNLQAATVGDELKLANNRKSKVVSMAIKDRGAILPAGHDADSVVWFDARRGNWITSSWYTTSTLPAFAQRANEARLADRWANDKWDLLLPEEAYSISMPVDAPGIAPGRPIGFPKIMSPDGKPGKEYYDFFTLSPFANEMVFETAKMAVESEAIGQDVYTDFLCLSFSTTDAIGHAYGPHSREIQDCVVRADRQLANFLNYLNGAIPGGLDNVLVVLTADHGGAALPEWLTERKFPAKRVSYDDIIQLAESALAEQWPDVQTTGLVLFSDPYVRFRLPVMHNRGIDVDKAAEVVAEKLKGLEGIRETYTRRQILLGQLPANVDAAAITAGFHRERSGEVVVLNDQYCYNSRYPSGSTHGTGFNYDTHVPLIVAGSKIKPGAYTRRIDVRDIAPTLSFLLGISPPASSEGRIISEIIR